MRSILVALLVVAATQCHFGRHHNFGHAPRPHHGRHMFGGQHDAMALFEQIGQIQRHIESKMMKFSSPIVTEVIVVEDKPMTPVHNFGSKYDQCLDKLNVILDNMVNCARLCLDRRWQDTVPIVQRSIHLLIEDIKCFRDASQVSENGIDPQCIRDHLSKAADILTHIFDDLRRFDFEAIQHHVQELVETLADIRNC